ncbi:hypothetical protein [Streptomyces aureus]|uniref:Integrase n=1 Tax=Streptomyces aureus TaxID=193461 RepID=A0ABV4SNU6_9ACTN
MPSILALQGFAERRVGSVQREYTEWILILNGRYLHAVLDTYTDQSASADC